MATYKSAYTGSQVDSAVGTVLDKDCQVKYGNLIGNIANQQDLQGAIDAAKVVCLTLTTEGGAPVLTYEDEVQTFNDIVQLIFEDLRFVYIKTTDSLLFPAIYDLEGDPAYIYFVGTLQTGTPGTKYLKIEGDDSLISEVVYLESTANKVTEITEDSTDAEYPTAKAVYNRISSDLIGVEYTQNKVTEITEDSTDTEYPSAKATYTLLNTALGDISEALAEIIGEEEPPV